MSGDAPLLPESRQQWVPMSPDARPIRGRRAWPWVVALFVLVALLVAAWFAADAVARSVVAGAIRQQVATQLDLPSEQPVDVSLEGSVLAQLIGGRLDDVTVSSDDVTLGALTGDVTVRARGIALRGDTSAEAASATIRLDEAQLRGLLATVDGFPADTVALAAPDVAVTIELSVLGLAVPIGVALTPSAIEGDIVLSPSALHLAGAEISADDLRDRFGGLARAVLRDWTVCLAEYIPAGVVLSEVELDGDLVVADLDIQPDIVRDPALQSPGTCE